MYNLINKTLILLIHLVPEFIIKIFANQYVAGISIDEALQTVRKLNKRKLHVTLDILGEHTRDKDKAELITNQYCEILDKIHNSNFNCNISIKPSHLGSDISTNLMRKNINKIHQVSIENRNFVRLDMEDSSLIDLTLKTYKERYKSQNTIGVVLQSYLYRTKKDLLNLEDGSNIRLCKGIYNENQKIAIKDPNKINENYIKLLKTAFRKRIYVGIATHDTFLIKKIFHLINEYNIDNSMFEFQMLHGVPMGNIINNMLSKNYKVRIYVPFGEDWYQYSVRRIKENPNILKYVIKNIFRL